MATDTAAGSHARALRVAAQVVLKGSPESAVVNLAISFFLIAIVAALFGFSGIAAGAAGIAKILFVLFLVLFLVSLVAGLMRR